MSSVYLSGPLANCSYAEANGWREEAKKLLCPLTTIDPGRVWHANTEFLTKQQKQQLVDTDLADIAKCDVILACVWKPSSGTAMELVYGKQWRKLVVTVVPSMNVSPWIDYHSDVVFTGLGEAVSYIKKVKG